MPNTFLTYSDVNRKVDPIEHNEWYNSYVKLVRGTSSDIGTIAIVEKLLWVCLVSSVLPIVGFCQVPKKIIFKSTYFKYINYCKFEHIIT